MISQKIPHHFYLDKDVVAVGKRLIGKVLMTQFDGQLTGGIITETEAYRGETDRACHAYGGRRTKRTETMYAEGGVAYIYLCYGIHHLFNIVTHQSGIPHAVLVRALHPLEGIQKILERRNKPKLNKTICGGPGTSAQGLGLHTSQNGTSLTGDRIWLEDRNIYIPENHIHTGPRIGVDYAGEDALLPYRFRLTPGYFFNAEKISPS